MLNIEYIHNTFCFINSAALFSMIEYQNGCKVKINLAVLNYSFLYNKGKRILRITDKGFDITKKKNWFHRYTYSHHVFSLGQKLRSNKRSNCGHKNNFFF